MRLTELFRPGDLIVDFAPDDKWVAVERLVEHLAAGGRIPAEAVDPVRQAVLARERSQSTGMERGIAIPHAAVDGVEEIAAALGIVRTETGLPFECIDGHPARLVVLLVIPRRQKLLHIRTLADVARVLGRDEVREALLAADTAQDAWEALRRGEA
jgi:mannitol/fructose-specific phosphotransferase system IIA component (Ntr-type)